MPQRSFLEPRSSAHLLLAPGKYLSRWSTSTLTKHYRERRKTVDPLQKDFILYLNFKGVKADEIHRITAWSLKTVRRNIAAHSKQDFIRVHPDFERRFLEVG
jgi:hypothetical protein